MMGHSPSRRIGILGLAVFAAGLGLTSSALAQAEIHVSNLQALVDERIEISVSGLESSQLFTLRATTLDQRNRRWVAEAPFRADEQGRASLAEVAPEAGGSYEGVDAMGLFWSAAPPVAGAQIAHRAAATYTTTLELIVDAEVLDAQTVARTFVAPEVLRIEAADGGIAGVYYRPAGDGPFPAVAVFAGSDGGLESAEWRAALLASRGIAALAVGVFRHEGRPDDLVEIPLEYGAVAVGWLRNRSETGQIGLVGFSKGSELVLSLAARDPSIRAVVAISPTAFVWPGITDGPPESRSSWTWQGEPLPPIPWTVGPQAGAMFSKGPPFLLKLLYEESLQAVAPEVRAAAAIPVAHIEGRVLLVSGEEDGSWPAAHMADLLVQRMTEAGKAQRIDHLRYSDAGHLIFWDYLPTTSAERNQGQIFGGTPRGTATARADSWPRIQAFLRDALAQPPSQKVRDWMGGSARCSCAGRHPVFHRAKDICELLVSPVRLRSQVR